MQRVQPYPSYRGISAVRSGIWLCCIIIANCFCSALICVCLGGFSKIENLTRWEKRSFNTLSLLLSAALGFGICFLFNQAGLMARGTILQGGPYSKKEVGYILRGTLSAYTWLFKHQVHQVLTGKRRVTSATFVLVLYLLCSLLGSFGVAFLGLTFNVEGTLDYRPPLFRPDWQNGTLHRDNSIQTALNAELHLSGNEQNNDAKRTAFTTSDVAGSIFQMAQVEKGPPWLVPRLNASFPYLNNSRAASYAMHLSNIENANLTLEDSGENTVAFKYKFQDFQGETSVLAGSTPPALLETRCQQYVTTSQDMAGPLITTNLTAYLMNEYSYRWISPLFGYQFDTSGNLLRNTTLQMWLIGKSGSYQNLESLVQEHSYLANRTIVFNCSIYFDSEILAHTILDPLKYSVVLPFANVAYGPDGVYNEVYRDFYSTLEFDFGISRQNRTASALWLSAYIGNYIGNCLSYLNEVLERIEVKKEMNGTKTKLEVKWRRVAATLGGLAGFQILFGLAALFYCKQGFQIVDDVSTLSSMLADFPRGSEEEGPQKGGARGGFVSQGDGVRWEFLGDLEEILG